MRTADRSVTEKCAAGAGDLSRRAEFPKTQVRECRRQSGTRDRSIQEGSGGGGKRKGEEAGKNSSRRSAGAGNQFDIRADAHIGLLPGIENYCGHLERAFWGEAHGRRCGLSCSRTTGCLIDGIAPDGGPSARNV